MINKEIAFKFSTKFGEFLFFANQIEFDRQLLANSVLDKSYTKYLSYAVALEILNLYKDRFPSICFIDVTDSKLVGSEFLTATPLTILQGEIYSPNQELIDQLQYSELILEKIEADSQLANTRAIGKSVWLHADFKLSIPNLIASVKLSANELKQLEVGDTLLLDVYEQNLLLNINSVN